MTVEDDDDGEHDLPFERVRAGAWCPELHLQQEKRKEKKDMMKRGLDLGTAGFYFLIYTPRQLALT